MRANVHLKEELYKKAMELSGIKSKTALIHAGLEALIAQYARKKLIALGGKDKSAKAPKRRNA